MAVRAHVCVCICACVRRLMAGFTAHEGLERAAGLECAAASTATLRAMRMRTAPLGCTASGLAVGSPRFGSLSWLHPFIRVDGTTRM